MVKLMLNVEHSQWLKTHSDCYELLQPGYYSHDNKSMKYVYIKKKYDGWSPLRTMGAFFIPLFLGMGFFWNRRAAQLLMTGKKVVCIKVSIQQSTEKKTAGAARKKLSTKAPIQQSTGKKPAGMSDSSHGMALYEAASGGKIKKTKLLLAKIPYHNYRQSDLLKNTLRSALYGALENGHREIALLILANQNFDLREEITRRFTYDISLYELLIKNKLCMKECIELAKNYRFVKENFFKAIALACEKGYQPPPLLQTTDWGEGKGLIPFDGFTIMTSKHGFKLRKADLRKKMHLELENISGMINLV